MPENRHAIFGPDTGDDQLLSWVPRLRRYARALVGNRDDADDLVQDTLERALSKSALWRGVADMRAWLFSMMTHASDCGVAFKSCRVKPEGASGCR